jgi:hypothetical protein
MNTLLIIILAVAGLVALLLIVAAFSKKSYSMEESISIGQPVDTVFNYIRFLKNQEQYNKWVMMDPMAVKTYKGKDGEIGAIQTWNSKNKQVGEGEQEIKGIAECKRIDFEIRFFRPFKGISPAYFITEKQGEASTGVRWGFSGTMPYPMNIMLLFIDIPGIMSADMKTSLGTLKNVLEQKSQSKNHREYETSNYQKVH